MSELKLDKNKLKIFSVGFAAVTLLTGYWFANKPVMCDDAVVAEKLVEVNTVYKKGKDGTRYLTQSLKVTNVILLQDRIGDHPLLSFGAMVNSVPQDASMCQIEYTLTNGKTTQHSQRLFVWGSRGSGWQIKLL